MIVTPEVRYGPASFSQWVTSGSVPRSTEAPVDTMPFTGPVLTSRTGRRSLWARANRSTTRSGVVPSATPTSALLANRFVTIGRRAPAGSSNSSTGKRPSASSLFWTAESSHFGFTSRTIRRTRSGFADSRARRNCRRSWVTGWIILADVHRLLTRASIVGAILAVQFVLFETGLRLQAGSEAAPEFRALFADDDQIGHVLNPGATAHFSTVEFSTDIRINQAGVRDEELGEKPPNERRIVVLGDSLVMAVQVPLAETFAKRLQHRLNEPSGPLRYRVINAGVQGYGPVEEQLFFAKMAATLQPDLVIITVYVGNDAIEAFDSASKLIPRDTSSAVASTDELLERLRRIARRSMVLQIARLRVQTVLARLRTATPERPLVTYLADEDPLVTRGLAITAESIQAIEDDAAAHGARVAVLLLPARLQLNDRNFEDLETSVREAGGRMERDIATVRFRRAVETLEIPMLDPLPGFRARPDREDLYFLRTAHFTPLGHEALAEQLERFLRQEQLVAGPASVPTP